MKMDINHRFMWRVRAFSLIEILIAIAILAVLASLAIPQYRKFVYKSRQTEVRVILPAIAQAQDLRENEKGTYITCGFYPSAGDVSNTKQIWPEPNCFSENLHFSPKGGTYCVYAVAAGDFSTRPLGVFPTDGQEITPTPGIDITVIAKCDIDGDGKYAYFTITDESTEIKGPFGDDF